MTTFDDARAFLDRQEEELDRVTGKLDDAVAEAEEGRQNDVLEAELRRRGVAPWNAPSLADFFARKLALLDSLDPWSKGTLHASDLGATLPGEGCLRAVWLRTHGFPERAAPVGKRLMLYKAQEFHRLLEGWLAEDSLGLGGGWRVAGIEEDVSEGGQDGRLDILLHHQDSGTLLVKDLKTINAGGFHYLKKDGPKPAHVLQVRHYMRAKGADLGQICYIDREGSAGFWESEPFGRADQEVELAWEILQLAAGPDAPSPAPVPPAEKDGVRSLPWMCRYLSRTGEEICCPYLDTPGCPGALPSEERPQEEFIWTRRKVNKKGGR